MNISFRDFYLYKTNTRITVSGQKNYFIAVYRNIMRERTPNFKESKNKTIL